VPPPRRPQPPSHAMQAIAAPSPAEPPSRASSSVIHPGTCSRSSAKEPRFELADRQRWALLFLRSDENFIRQAHAGVAGRQAQRNFTIMPGKNTQQHSLTIQAVSTMLLPTNLEIIGRNPEQLCCVYW
jgi:hypothetical protein